MKSTIKTHLIILLLAGLGGGLHAQPSAPPNPYRTILEGGEVEAMNSVRIESELEGTSTINWIVDEGTRVKKGDPLVELDPGSLKQMINSAEIGKLVASNDLAKAKGKLELAKLSNALATKMAENARLTAETNLQHFQSVGMKTTIDDLQARVAVAAERIRAAEKILTLKGNPALQVEVINAQVTLLEAQRVMKLAQAELKQFQKHTAPQKLRDLNNAVVVAENEIANTKVNNKASLSTADHEVALQENKLREAESKLADLHKQLANAKIFAPTDGLVVYHVAESSRYGSSSSIIEKGAAIKKGQDILQIVDLSKLSVSLKVHESRVLQVHKGAPVSVKLASLPGRTIRGEVSYIAPVASAAERWGSGKKVYKTEVRLLNPPAHVRPGESAIAEITLTPPPRPGIGGRPGIDRPGSSRARPGGAGTRPSSGTRPGGGNSLASTSFKAPDELKLTTAQKLKWAQAAKTSKAAFDAAMQRQAWSELREIRDEFNSEIKKFLTAEQMAAYEKSRAQQSQGGGNRGGRGGGISLMRYDTNGDGKVSKTEYGAVSERARQFMGDFDGLDTNGDGFVDSTEEAAWRQKLMERFRGAGGSEGGSTTPKKENPRK